MKFLYLIHIYQPPYQTKDILLKVVRECYLKLFKIINQSSKAKIILNINGSLSQLLHEWGANELLREIRQAADTGKIEFTGSAAYHPILPLLSEDEITRQIELNNELNRRIIGETYQPVGFFCPEMCYSPRISPVIRKAGFEWAIIDEIAFNGTISSYPKNCVFADDNLTLLLRNRDISNALAFSIWRKKSIYRSEQLKKLVREYPEIDEYLCLATDGEVFGHHMRNRENLLRELLNDNEIQWCGFADVASVIPKVQRITPIESSWSSQQFELEDNTPFSLWNDPTNRLHALQWEFVRFGMELLHHTSGNDEFRNRFDKCLCSDQFFWASCRPWWDGMMVEKGAQIVYDTILSAESTKEHDRRRATTLWKEILGLVEEWNEKGIATSKRRRFLKRSGINEDRVKKVLM